jgi:RNA polymerase sigma factor (sigma-70 family)
VTISGERQERFRELFALHAVAVERYARHRVASHDVDDVVAETFVVVWRRLDDGPREVLPWILGVARNVIANRRRSERRRVALLVRIASQTSSQSNSVPDEESPTCRALSQLAESDRETLMLVAWDGLSPAQAAGVVGCSPAAFRVRLHRARRRLEAQLAIEARPSPRPLRTEECVHEA